jgi:hypothetical protein
VRALFAFPQFGVNRPSRSGRSSLHALVIGIDHFASSKIPDLHGAVADANAIDDYLRTDLRTPAAQIANLRNADATRAQILAEIRGLATDPAIRFGDPILIYFAGHGTSAAAPPRWHAGGDPIQLIVPYDCCVPDSATDVLVPPIPARTLCALLETLAHAKSDNIVSLPLCDVMVALACR